MVEVAEQEERRAVRVGIRLEPALHDRVAVAAERDHRSVSSWVRLAILEALMRRSAKSEGG
jgi:predicted HicB family RNase H-like nuclease